MSATPFQKQPGNASLNGVVLAQGSTAPVAIKYNLTATTAPAVGNDSTQGYSVGSIWINNTAQTAYLCASAAVGAAAWKQAQASTSAVDGFTATTLTGGNTVTLQKGVNDLYNEFTGTNAGGASVINILRSGAQKGDRFVINIKSLAGVSSLNSLTIQENSSGSLVVWNQTTTALNRSVLAVFNGTAWEAWNVMYPMNVGYANGDTLYFDGSNWQTLSIGLPFQLKRVNSAGTAYEFDAILAEDSNFNAVTGAYISNSGGAPTTILTGPGSGSYRIKKMRVINNTSSAVTYTLTLSDGTNTITLESAFTLGPLSTMEYGWLVINSGGSLTAYASAANAVYIEANYVTQNAGEITAKVTSLNTANTDIISAVTAGHRRKIPCLYVKNTTSSAQTFTLTHDADGSHNITIANAYTIGPLSTVKFDDIFINSGGTLKGLCSTTNGNVQTYLAYADRLN